MNGGRIQTQRQIMSRQVIPRQTHNYRISIQDNHSANSVIMRLTRNYLAPLCLCAFVFEVHS